MSIDIHDPVTDICARLGLEPSYVSRLVLTPSGAIAEVYKPRESDGAKYIAENGEPAMERLAFEVST